MGLDSVASAASLRKSNLSAKDHSFMACFIRLILAFRYPHSRMVSFRKYQTMAQKKQLMGSAIMAIRIACHHVKDGCWFHKEERKSNIQCIKQNLYYLYEEMKKMSDALRIDLDEIINKKG